MAAGVNPPRVREEQAARTRRRILDAAGELFVSVGYTRARIEDIADQAGVAIPTVYKVFTNKRTLLVSALDRRLRGEGDESPLDQQSWFTEQLTEPDPVRQLALIARNARRMYERAAPLLDVLRAAAPTDPELAGAWDEFNAQRVSRSRRTAASLVKKSGHRVRLGRDDLAITLLALTEPELFATYTRSSRSADAYEAWLADLLCRAVLDES